MRPCPLLVALLLAAPAVSGEMPAAAAPSDGPAPRPLAQAAAKSALGDTRLDEAMVSEVHGDVQGFARAWAERVMELGTAAAAEDLRAVVDEGLRDKLQARGIALSQQEAIIDAVRLQAEAAIVDHARMVAAQARFKRALEASGTEEPALSDVLEQVKGWADDAHEAVIVPGVAGAEREPAVSLVEREAGPLLDEHEFPDRHRADALAALVDWLEARAAVEGEAAWGR